MIIISFKFLINFFFIAKYKSFYSYFDNWIKRERFRFKKKLKKTYKRTHTHTCILAGTHVYIDLKITILKYIICIIKKKILKFEFLILFFIVVAAAYI